ncbi:hypothetical protein Tco_0884314, partial [Tanacetum coccineum]
YYSSELRYCSRELRYCRRELRQRVKCDALRKCILEGPYTPSTVTIPAVPATDNSLAVPERTTVETILNMSPKNKAHFKSEKEAIHLILTEIGDDIYSTVDACKTTHEMWEAIERLQQGESLNIQDVKTNLFWEFGKFTSHEGELMESYYSRFYKLMNEMIRNNLTVAIMQVNVQFLQQLQPEWSRFVIIVKQQHKLDEVSYHKLFDILKQYQKEVNEIHAKRISKNANPLALVATTQPYQDPYYETSKSHKSSAPTSKASLHSRCQDKLILGNSQGNAKPISTLLLLLKTLQRLYYTNSQKASLPTTNPHSTTRHKGKEIAKLIAPPSESASKEDSDPKQAQKDKDITSSNTRNKNVDTTPRYKNDNQTGQFRNQRAVNVAGARDTVGGQVVQQSRIQCFNCKELVILLRNAESQNGLKTPQQSDWLADTNEEIDEQELEAHYSYMARIQEVPNEDSRTDSEPLEQQSESISDICVVGMDDSNVIPNSPDMCDNDIQNDQNDVECDDERVALANLIANLKLDVDENKKIQKQLKKANATLTQELTECKYILTETSRTLGESNSIRDSCLVALQNKQTELEEYMAFKNRTIDYEKLEHKTHADLKYVESLEDEIDELEFDKAEFSNMYDMLLQECVSNDVMCSYLHSLSDLDAHSELQCLYLHKVKECECLAQKLSKQTESVSKEVYTELLQSFAKLEKHSISLELALQHCQEQMKNDTICKEKASNVFLKEREQYFEIQDLKAQLQDKNIAISELKKLVVKCKEKSVETKFDKPFVVRQPNAQRIPKPSVLGKPTPFSDSLERNFTQTQSVNKTNVSESLSKPVTSQTLPQTARQSVRNTNVIKPGMYRINTRTTQSRQPQTSRNTNPRVSTSTGVIHRTNVSRPQLRSTQMKEKVVPNNSHVKDKKTEVEDHHRISSISNKTKSVTASNDSLKSKTSNVNAVCATCEKCVFNSNHDACVSKFLNDVNARTKKPNIVPISTRKPKSQANKYVATPPKKIVASESTTQKSKSYYRMLYEKSSKAWKWWIEQKCPSGYKWVPKTKTKWVPKVRNENVQKRVSFAIDNASRITSVLKLTNTVGSNLSCIPSSSNSLADCTTHPIYC